MGIIEEVEKCCDCPLADKTSQYEWSEYECEFGPEPKPHPSGKGIVAEVIKSGTEEPPQWCPLRNGDVVVRRKGMTEGKKKHKIVYTITEDTDGRSFWNKMGVAFVNRDESLTVLLHGLPVNGRLHIRDAPEDAKEQER
jgi:hypothetical protein